MLNNSLALEISFALYIEYLALVITLIQRCANIQLPNDNYFQTKIGCEDRTIRLNLNMNQEVKLLNLAFLLHLKELLKAQRTINYILVKQAESLKGN